MLSRSYSIVQSCSRVRSSLTYQTTILEPTRLTISSYNLEKQIKQILVSAYKVKTVLHLIFITLPFVFNLISIALTVVFGLILINLVDFAIILIIFIIFIL